MTRSILTWAAFLSVVVFPVFGSEITADGSYHEFHFNGALSEAFGCSGNCALPSDTTNFEETSTPPWTFTGPGALFVFDVGHTGDRFEAFDSTTSLGTTSAVANEGISFCDFNIGCAIADTRYSRGTFNLGEGAHEIHLFVIQNALGTGGGDTFFSLSAVPEGVPEPGTTVLVTIGLAFVTLGRLRRKK